MIASASPRTRVQVVELVGANSSGQASTFFGISKTAEDCLARVLFPSLVIEIIGIFIFLQNKIKFNNLKIANNEKSGDIIVNSCKLKPIKTPSKD